MIRSALFVIALWLIGLGAFAYNAHAHEPYTDWLSPHGWKCCSDLERECRRVKSKVDDETGGFLIHHQGAWRPVPPTAVLHDKESPDGDSHACVRKGTLIIDCFVKGKAKI